MYNFFGGGNGNVNFAQCRGSVMMTIPKAVLEELGLSANTKVDVSAEAGG